MNVWFTPSWWRSAASSLLVALLMVGAGLFNLVPQSGLSGRLSGAFWMFLAGISLMDAMFRYRNARSAQN